LSATTGPLSDNTVTLAHPINDFTNPYGARNDNATAVGFAAIAQFGATAIGHGAQAVILSTALGNGAIASGFNSVALGANSIASVDNTVSVGAVGIERRIVNVAAGSFSAGSTDAINGGQLYNIITALPFDSNNAANAAITSASGANSSALGYGANASASGAVALGNSSTASASSAIALGFNARPMRATRSR
jgi:trimeric autotransporter adhesin